jgi:hypothetical protein
MGGSQGQWPNELELGSTEIFDPATQTWTEAAGLPEPRTGATAFPMADGKILMFGGGQRVPSQSGLVSLSTTDTYDATAGVWQSAPPLPGPALVFGFSDYTTTVLSDGSVLGIGLLGDSAALLDPARTAWRSTTATAPAEPIASVLPNGSVLVVGTNIYAGGPSHATVYDPTQDKWTPTVRPSGWYYGGTLTPLGDGSVLAVSGTRAVGGQGAERYVLRQPSP